MTDPSYFIPADLLATAVRCNDFEFVSRRPLSYDTLVKRCVEFLEWAGLTRAQVLDGGLTKMNLVMFECAMRSFEAPTNSYRFAFTDLLSRIEQEFNKALESNGSRVV